MSRLYTVLFACLVLAIVVSGCTGGEIRDGGPDDSGDRPWPRLFDVKNVSWYRYDMINASTGIIERNLTVRYGEDPRVSVDWQNVSGGAPVTVTNIEIAWLDSDRRYETKIYTDDQNGYVLYLDFWVHFDGMWDSLAPVHWGNPVRENPWAIRSEFGDLAALSDDRLGRSLHVSGFDFVSYNGSSYYCSVYESDNDSMFRAWHNASIPVPLKMVANGSDPSIMKGLWKFVLTGWG